MWLKKGAVASNHGAHGFVNKQYHVGKEGEELWEEPNAGKVPMPVHLFSTTTLSSCKSVIFRAAEKSTGVGLDCCYQVWRPDQITLCFLTKQNSSCDAFVYLYRPV